MEGGERTRRKTDCLKTGWRRSGFDMRRAQLFCTTTAPVLAEAVMLAD